MPPMENGNLWHCAPVHSMERALARVRFSRALGTRWVVLLQIPMDEEPLVRDDRWSLPPLLHARAISDPTVPPATVGPLWLLQDGQGGPSWVQ